jgi:PAS domain-containing protein
MEHVPYVFSIFDPANIEIVYINRAYESIWGRSRQSIYRRPFSFLDAVHPEDQEKACTRLVKVLRGQASVLDYRIVPCAGEVR